MSDTTLSNLTAQLGAASRLLDVAQAELADAELRAVQCRSRADVAEAEAFMNATGNIEERKRQALVVAQELLLQAETADAGLRTARSKIKVIQTKIDVGRT